MRDVTQLSDLIFARLRGLAFSFLGQTKFKLIGRQFKYYGIRHISGTEISVGDNCWFEAVTSYRGHRYDPSLVLGVRSMFSGAVHISAVRRIQIGADCLFGSNIYVGDHSHGTTDPVRLDPNVPPASRALDDIAEIVIGDRVWIGDGVVILAGSRIGDGCVIGANSVVKGDFPSPAIIAGIPARVVKELA